MALLASEVLRSARRVGMYAAVAVLAAPMILAVEPPSKPADSTTRVASVDPKSRHSERASQPLKSSSIDEALAAIASCQKTFAKVKDYTCTFYKNERVGGKLTGYHAMQMKARTDPKSFYFKFITPKKGREAIYSAGKFSDKAVVHDVGLGKLLAGTLQLDPEGSMAMDGCRHPITDAGIGHMIETVSAAWNRELRSGESEITIHPRAKVGDRVCTRIESVHPVHRSSYMYHRVNLYIDQATNLPIRFEAYDWPRSGNTPELMEEYTYTDLKINTGLTDRDFDPSNSHYAFGRF